MTPLMRRNVPSADHHDDDSPASSSRLPHSAAAAMPRRAAAAPFDGSSQPWLLRKPSAPAILRRSGGVVDRLYPEAIRGRKGGEDWGSSGGAAGGRGDWEASDAGRRELALPQVEQVNVPDINIPPVNNDMVIDAVQPQLQIAPVLPQIEIPVQHEVQGPILNFDLNDPAPEDPIAAHMEIEEEAPVPVQNLQLNIIPQEDGNLQDNDGNFLDHQVLAQVDDQLQLPPINFDNLLNDEPEEQQQQGNNEHLHIGFMEFADQVTVDPVFESFVSPTTLSSQKRINADIYRLWAKHFSPTGSSSAVVEIPADWLNFFTTMLLSPTHFSWAKNFLSSKAWDIFNSKVDNDRGLKFSLPSLCPKDGPVTCLAGLTDETTSYPGEGTHDLNVTATNSETYQDNRATPVNTKSAASTLNLSKTVPIIRKKTTCKVAIVETDVRRSDRLKKKNEGFKANSCSHWNCVACTNEPPVLSPSLIKDLGTSFAQVAPEEVNEQALQKKRKSKTAIGKHDNEASTSSNTENHKEAKSKAAAGKKPNPSGVNGSKKPKK
ncbi:hypothetical protein EJB05_33825, partial [Eragrostis curvula]